MTANTLSDLIRNQSGPTIVRNNEGNVLRALQATERTSIKTSSLLQPSDLSGDSKRVMTTTNSAGLQPNQSLMSFKQAIYFYGVLAKLGVTTTDHTFANQNSVSTISKINTQWLAEDEEVTGDLATIGQLDFESYTIGGGIEITRRLAKQVESAEGNAENVLRRTIASSVRDAAASAFFNGTGLNNQPTGILNIAGLTTIDAVATSDNGITQLASALKTYEDGGYDPDACRIAVGTDFMRKARIAYETGQAFTQGGMIERFIPTPLMPANSALIGDFSEDNVEILASDSIDLTIVTGNSANDNRNLYGFHCMDIAVHRPGAFIRINNL